MSRYMTLSSAKRRTVEVTHLGWLLMYTKNIAGPRTDPWGTVRLRTVHHYRLCSSAEETSDPFECCGVDAIFV